MPYPVMDDLPKLLMSDMKFLLHLQIIPDHSCFRKQKMGNIIKFIEDEIKASNGSETGKQCTLNNFA